MLEVTNLSAHYGQHVALQDVSLNVAKGEIVVILGANGAGKSTLLRAISRISEGEVDGEVRLNGRSLDNLTPDQIVELGIALVPEGRGIFGDLSVRENLLLGAYSARARPEESANLEHVLSLFPKLRERQDQIARTMSGGEQQMVAIGRAMMSRPEILMLDEPSLGLSPLLCKELFQNLAAVKDMGIGILLVEQNAKQSLAIADRGYLLEHTRIIHEDLATKLARDPAVQQAYLGARGGTDGQKATWGEVEHEIKRPAASFFSARPQPRRTAEQQIGASIDALITSATAKANDKPAPMNDSSKSFGPAHETRLATIIKEIETAATDARERPKSRPIRHAPRHKSPDALSTAKNNMPIPIIEIYRRPRIEVYKRRADGQFQQDLGKS